MIYTTIINNGKETLISRDSLIYLKTVRAQDNDNNRPITYGWWIKK